MQDGDHVGGDPEVGSRITNKTKPASTFIFSGNAIEGEATSAVEDTSYATPNARASCWGGKNQDFGITSFRQDKEGVGNSEDHEFQTFLTAEDEYQEDEEGANIGARIKGRGGRVLRRSGEFRWRSRIGRGSWANNSSTREEEEDGNPGFWSEEAHLCVQDLGLSKEASEDTKEGRKLLEEAEEEVDRK